MSDFEGKVVCITGGSGGVGKATALALAREGADVILVARTLDNLARVAKEIKEETGRNIAYCAVDISKPDQLIVLADMVKKIGKVDILINGAAGFSEETLDDMDINDVVSMFDTISRGTALVTKVLLPYLKESKGHIINIVTDWGLPGLSGPAPFSAAKWAVAGLGEALSKELIGYGIKVVNLYPGDIASDMDLDASMVEIQNEHGISMIPLVDIVSTIKYVLSLRLSRVLSLVILPIDPAYVE